MPATTIVMMPGTHPRTLECVSEFSNAAVHTYESDHDCAMMARQTWSPASNQAARCQVIVRSLISCSWSSFTKALMT